jgi:hypothetical protein
VEEVGRRLRLLLLFAFVRNLEPQILPSAQYLIRPGTDVMILKIFSPKKFGEKWRF